MNMIRNNKPLSQIAVEREIALTTVLSHVTEFIKEGNSLDFPMSFEDIFDEEVEKLVLEAIEEAGQDRLKPIKDLLPSHITYDQIRGVILKNSY